MTTQLHDFGFDYRDNADKNCLDFDPDGNEGPPLFKNSGCEILRPFGCDLKPNNP